nr:unnamed protein product [Digitaria exilis]
MCGRQAAAAVVSFLPSLPYVTPQPPASIYGNAPGDTQLVPGVVVVMLACGQGQTDRRQVINGK